MLNFRGVKKVAKKKKGSFGIPLLSKCFFILVGDDWTPGGYMQDLKMNAWKMIHFLDPAYFQGLCLLVSGLPGLISETGFGYTKMSDFGNVKNACLEWWSVLFRSIIFCWWIFWYHFQNHPTIEGLNVFFRWYKLKFHAKSPEFLPQIPL